jgi:hypothetical protein
VAHVTRVSRCEIDPHNMEAFDSALAELVACSRAYGLALHSRGTVGLHDKGTAKRAAHAKCASLWRDAPTPLAEELEQNLTAMELIATWYDIDFKMGEREYTSAQNSAEVQECLALLRRLFSKV